MGDKSLTKMSNDLNELLGLSIDWTKLDYQDLEQLHAITEDQQTKLEVVKNVAQEQTVSELTDILQVVNQEKSVGLGFFIGGG
jgi:hypothetical protein